MMKKLLLAVLPALLVLSACSAPQPKEKAAPVFQEDTLAHEEVFGNGGLNKGILKSIVVPDASQPTLGIQTQENGGNISIRFVAAISTGSRPITDITAKWTRAMFNANGTPLREEAEFESLVAYTSLNDGSSVLGIDDFAGGVYDYFIVYSMLNIPKSDYAKCYLNAYVEVGGIKSKVLATTVDQTTRFTFSDDDLGCFGVKKASNVFTTFESAPEENLAQYWAAFGPVSLNVGDSFLLAFREKGQTHASDKFEVYGFDRLREGDNVYEGHPNGFYEFTQAGSSQFSVCDEKAAVKRFYFYLENDTNHIEPKYAFTKTVELNPGVWNSTGSPDYYVNIVNTGFGHDGWVKMSLENGNYKCTVTDVPDDGAIIFCRANPEMTSPNWGQIWNQTGDLDLWNIGNGVYSISGWENGPNGKSGGSWGSNS